MLRVNRHFVWSVFLILVVIINLMNVNVALADDGAPPPPATEDATQPPVEPTDPPVIEETPAATETPVSDEQAEIAEEADVSAVLETLPENTPIVVLDENGAVLPLGSEGAAQIILDTDPMWCPVIAGVPTLPGGAGCSPNFTSGQLLINDMDNSNPASNASMYESDGVIYFTTNPGGSFALVPGSGAAIDIADYNALKSYSLIFQGGWNGSNGGAATFTGQTNFGTNTLTVGTSGNPWVGNITLINFAFNNVSSSNAVTVYTTSGDITLDNVDVSNQRGNHYTALLDSTSGDITVQNGSTFDGNNSGGASNRNLGFSAKTNTGSITISDTTFQESKTCLNLGFLCIDALANSNGATLNAPTVELTNVSASNNDASGIEITANTVTLNSVTANNNDLSGVLIHNANLINLNNVTATNNGSLLILGNGVQINGTGSTIANVTGGTFSNNQPYGIYITGGTINYLSPATCSGNLLPLPFIDPDNCDNILDTTPPVLTLPANITAEATSAAGAVVNFTATANDNIDGARPVTCTPASGSTFPIGTTTVNCSASDTNGNTANGSFTVTVQDTTPPVLTLPANITAEATSAAGAAVNFTATANDNIDGARPVTCTPASGSTFPIGTTTVNCSASDTNGNTANGSFTVTVQDTTPPVISPMADIVVHTLSELGAQAFYTPPSTSDIVDGAGVAICTPASGSLFAPGNTTVTCTASDSHSNTSSITFNVHINLNPSTPGSSGFGGAFILVTGGEVIDLDCNATVNAFGATVKFHNLCGHQAVINEVGASALPGALPSGYSFVQGLDVQVLSNGQPLASLPKASGVEIDFPLPDGSTYAALYWDNGKWIEITQPMDASDLFNILSTDATVELYKMSSSNGSFQNVLTTDLTGVFVLVKK